MLTAAAATSRAAHAADEIRAAIRDGRYPPGTRLVERRLAAELGTSHIPVREALARLAEEGLVEHRPHRSARVADLSERQLDELTSLRTALEQLVVVRAQERMTTHDEAELRELVARMERAAERGDVRRVLALDRRFHERLWELSEHELAQSMATQLRARVDAFLHAVLSSLDRDALRRQAHAHVAMLEAIAGRDPGAARDAVAEHIGAAAAQLRRRPAAEAGAQGAARRRAISPAIRSTPGGNTSSSGGL